MGDFLRGRKVIGLLLASLALNIFLLGMMAAQHVFDQSPPPIPMPPPPRIMIERLAGELSEAGRKAILAQYDAMGGVPDDLFQALVTSQSNVMREFSNERFDGTAYRLALNERKAAADRFFTAMSEFFMKVGADLSSADRRRVVERGRL
ncbi:MAG: periplasmic heavy metal sensor [Proteobacteria bacterium]|nr:periplasmic heavy metal sensor [Pseudomonadota bacterium]